MLALKLAGVLVPALIGGLVLGKATVADLRPILPDTPVAYADPSETVVQTATELPAGGPRADTYRLAGYGEAMVDCTDCSDYALGYRWAEMSAVRDVSACMTDSWSFQRGCVAFVRGMPRPAA